MASWCAVASALTEGDGKACEGLADPSQPHTAERSSGVPDTAGACCGVGQGTCEDRAGNSTMITVLLQCASCNLCSCQWTSDNGLARQPWHWMGPAPENNVAQGCSAADEVQSIGCGTPSATDAWLSSEFNTKLPLHEERFHSFVTQFDDLRSEMLCKLSRLEESIAGTVENVLHGDGAGNKAKLDLLDKSFRVLEDKVDSCLRGMASLQSDPKVNAKRFASAEIRIAECEASLTTIKKMAKEAKTDQKVDGLRRLIADLPDRVTRLEADGAVSAVLLQQMRATGVELEDRMQVVKAECYECRLQMDCFSNINNQAARDLDEVRRRVDEWQQQMQMCMNKQGLADDELRATKCEQQLLEQEVLMVPAPGVADLNAEVQGDAKDPRSFGIVTMGPNGPQREMKRCFGCRKRCFGCMDVWAEVDAQLAQDRMLSLPFEG